jgi:hypothetical protein
LNIDEALKAVLAPRVDGLLINADAVDFRRRGPIWTPEIFPWILENETASPSSRRGREWHNFAFPPRRPPGARLRRPVWIGRIGRPLRESGPKVNWWCGVGLPDDHFRSAGDDVLGRYTEL